MAKSWVGAWADNPDPMAKLFDYVSATDMRILQRTAQSKQDIIAQAQIIAALTPLVHGAIVDLARQKNDVPDASWKDIATVLDVPFQNLQNWARQARTVQETTEDEKGGHPTRDRQPR